MYSVIKITNCVCYSSGAFRSSPGGAGNDAPPAPPPLFLPPHLSHLSQHLNHLSQPFFPLKGNKIHHNLFELYRYKGWVKEISMGFCKE